MLIDSIALSPLLCFNEQQSLLLLSVHISRPVRLLSRYQFRHNGAIVLSSEGDQAGCVGRVSVTTDAPGAACMQLCESLIISFFVVHMLFHSYTDVLTPLLFDLRKAVDDRKAAEMRRLEEEDKAATLKQAGKQPSTATAAQADVTAITVLPTSSTAAAATSDHPSPDSLVADPHLASNRRRHTRVPLLLLLSLYAAAIAVLVSDICTNAQQRYPHAQHTAIVTLLLCLFASQCGLAVILDRTGFGVIGYITSSTILWLDIVVLLWCAFGPATAGGSSGVRMSVDLGAPTPLQACLLLAAVRFFCVIFGTTYYLCGHAILFLLLSCTFIHVLIDRAAPVSKLRRHVGEGDADHAPPSVLDALATGGSFQPAHARATAVREDPLAFVGNATTRANAAKRERIRSRIGQSEHRHSLRRNVCQWTSLFLLVGAFIFDTLYAYFKNDVSLDINILVRVQNANKK